MLFDRLDEILVRRGNHANIDGDLPGATNALDLSFFQRAEHLRLSIQAHVADLIEEDRPAVGKLELSRSAAPSRR